MMKNLQSSHQVLDSVLITCGVIRHHNIDNNQKYSLSSNQHIRMISEGSCDTEDWSNDAENSALITAINYILLYTCSRIEDSCFKL